MSTDTLDREERLDEVLADYLEAVEAGRAPDRHELLARYPDLAGDLAAFFDDRDRLDRLARPLRALSAANRPGSGDTTPGLEATGPELPAAAGFPAEPPVRTGPYVPEGEATALGSKGSAVAGYEVLDVLGRGGMGVVYKARQIALKRTVALKMILAGADAGPEQLARFRTEAEAVARLQHPNIVQIHEVGEHEGHPYFSLEYVDGGSLAQQLRGEPLPAVEAAQLLETLARAVHYAHERGIVHRDLKPANILLAACGLASAAKPQAADYVPKITDFGLAKQLDVESGHTSDGAVMGTPSYMAPEQAGGRTRDIGPPADIYALGVILYQLLTGRLPFIATSFLELCEQLWTREPPAPRSLMPKLPRDLETICLKCLRKEPARRYASAFDLAEDLRRFLDGEPIRARPVGALERTLKWMKRRPALTGFMAASVLAVVSLAVAGVVYLDKRARAAEEDTRIKTQELEALNAIKDRWKQYMDEGQAAYTAGNYGEAATQFTAAAATVEGREALLQLKHEAQFALAGVEKKAQENAAVEGAKDTYRRFVRGRHETLYRVVLLATCVDAASALLEIRKTATATLALFGVAVETGAAPAIDERYFTAAQKAEISFGCHELLLVLAEAEVHPVPGQPVEAARTGAERALAILERAAELGISTRAYHLRRGYCLAQAGHAVEARQEKERAQAITPSSAVDLFLVGLDTYRQGRPAEAVADLKAALQLEPKHFWGKCLLALCNLRLQRWAEAEARLTDCLGDRPDFVWGYVWRGFARGELRDFDGADKDFQSALAELKAQPSEAAAYGVHVNHGVVLIRQKRFADAVAELEQAIQLRPRQFQAYVNLAQAYQDQQKWDEARTALDQAVELMPSLPALYRSRARLHLLRKDSEAALKDLDRAIALEPSGSTSPALAEDHIDRGRILHRAGKFKEAREACDAALKIQPTNAVAYRLRAQVLLEQNHFPEALADLDQCVKLGKPDADVYQARGQVRSRLSNYAGAIEDYTQALELGATSAIRAQRGWLYLVTNAPELAAPDFEEVIRLDPQNGDAYNGRGFARVKLGNYRDGVADAEEALKRGPVNTRLFYNAARAYAQAVGKIDEPGQRTRQELMLRVQYQDRAVELLRKLFDGLPAAQRLPVWKELIQTERVFNPIRPSPGFLQLAVDYARPAK